jgi:hypothetical protein
MFTFHTAPEVIICHQQTENINIDSLTLCPPVVLLNITQKYILNRLPSFLRLIASQPKGARGSTMLQAARSRDRIPMKSLDFFNWRKPFQPHYGPGVDSATNRNEYQNSSWEVKGGRCVGLTTLRPSVSRLSRRCESLDLHNPMEPPRPVSGIALPFFFTSLILKPYLMTLTTHLLLLMGLYEGRRDIIWGFHVGNVKAYCLLGCDAE